MYSLFWIYSIQNKYQQNNVKRFVWKWHIPFIWSHITYKSITPEKKYWISNNNNPLLTMGMIIIAEAISAIKPNNKPFWKEDTEISRMNSVEARGINFKILNETTKFSLCHWFYLYIKRILNKNQNIYFLTTWILCRELLLSRDLRLFYIFSFSDVKNILTDIM